MHFGGRSSASCFGSHHRASQLVAVVLKSVRKLLLFLTISGNAIEAEQAADANMHNTDEVFY